jgi:hypothetical protein
MGEITTGVNWVAVVVGAVVAFALGWLWYSPKAFGSTWAQGIGISIDPSSAATPPAVAMIFQAVATFLLAWVVGVTAAMNALLTIILIVVTFVFLIAAGGKFSQKSNAAIAIEAGYVVAMVVVMMVVHANL